MEHHLNENESIEVEIEELEFLLGPDDPEVISEAYPVVCEQEGRQNLRILQLEMTGMSTWRPAKCDGTSVNRLLALQEEKARRNVQEV